MWSSTLDDMVKFLMWSSTLDKMVKFLLGMLGVICFAIGVEGNATIVVVECFLMRVIGCGSKGVCSIFGCRNPGQGR